MIQDSFSEKKFKILISVSLAFFLGFLVFFTIYYNYFNPVTSNDFDSILENPFFIQNQNIVQKKIFIFGSSQVRSINSDLINEKILTVKPEFVMYNIGYNMDNPNLRIKIIDKIIELNPKIVFYGLSYRDFTNPSEESQPLLDIKESIDSFEKEQFPYLISINPKFSTLDYIRTVFRTSPVFDANIITSDYAPFFEISTLQTKINKNIIVDEIDHINTPYEENEHVFYLKQIINELQKNNVKVVIFTLPLPQIYFDFLTNNDKKNFDLILENISKEYNIPIYDFTSKYSQLHIWTDMHHVAYNENSSIFSTDILEMILMELS